MSISQRAVLIAKNAMPIEVQEFVTIQNEKDVLGVPPIVFFQIQSDPIKEVGVNGLQVTDMLLFCKLVYEELDRRFPCKENSKTIDKIEEALMWQDKRTKDRTQRGVEGENKK